MPATPGPGSEEPATAAEDAPAGATPAPSHVGRHAGRRSFTRYLGLTLLGALVPGSAFWASGRRWLGGLVFAATLLLLGALAVTVWRVGPQRLGLELAVRPGAMQWLGIGLAATAVVWVVVMLASQRSLEPRSLSTWQRLVGSGLVVALCSVVAAPLALASQAAFTTRDTVESLFRSTPLVDGRDPGSLTKPVVTDPAAPDPWPGRDRINVLILGSDYTTKRRGLGIRTDTMILASIDKATGATVLFSLPRNLQKTPFPAGPFRNAYPDGFRTDQTFEDSGLLNEVYNVVPEDHPELFPKSVRDPGIEAIKLAVSGALGLPVDYYVMANIGGFPRIIDALGGVFLDVRYPIPINSATTESGCTTPEGYILPGEDKLLTGREALWFARARCGEGELAQGDNSRIRRQRCVVGAIVDRLDPATIASRYQALAAQVRRFVSTDVPPELLPAFVDLALKVRQQPVRSLAFTGTTLKGTNYDPDYPAMRRLVKRALAQSTADAAGGAAAAPERPSPSAGATPTRTRTSATASPSASPKATPDPEAGERSGTAEPLDAVC